MRVAVGRIEVEVVRGGYYGVTLHDYADRDDAFGFQPDRLRSDPALSDPARNLGHLARGRVQTAFDKDGQQIPFFMMPSVGGGSTPAQASAVGASAILNSLLLQAEWRIMVNRFLDTAVFYDTGKVAARRSGPRFRRTEARHRLRRPLSRARHYATARRTGQRATKDLHLVFSSSAAFLRLSGMSISSLLAPLASHAASVPRVVAVLGLFAGGCLDAGSALLLGRSDRPRTGVAGRLEGVGLLSRLDCTR